MVVGFHPMGVSHTVVHYPSREAVISSLFLMNTLAQTYSQKFPTDLIEKYY